MRARLSIKGHAVHQMIVPFPLAFFAGAVFFDILGWYTERPALWTTGGYLTIAGLLTALLAATAGIVDYALTVPPASSAKRRATAHMAFNTIAVLLFAYSAVWRGNPATEPTRAILVLQIAAMIALSAGAWMGGTLVTRNQIGVEHLYANAGKWKEEYFNQPRPGEMVTVAATNELQVGQMKLLHMNGMNGMNGTRVVLARTESGYCAFEDHCSHKGGSLCDGALVGGTVQCPWHGSQFDVRTGKVTAGPAGENIRIFPVRERERTVQIALDALVLEQNASGSLPLQQ